MVMTATAVDLLVNSAGKLYSSSIKHELAMLDQDIPDINLNALVICKSAQRRSLLQRGLSDYPTFETVRQSPTLEDGVTKLRSLKRCEMVLISTEFSHSEVINFINVLREIPASLDAATVILLDSLASSLDEEIMEEWQEIGIDTRLIAPYTWDAFKTIAEQAIKVNEQRRVNRLTAEMKTFINKLLAQLNLVALNKRSADSNLEKNYKALISLQDQVKGFTPEQQTLYLALTIDLTTAEQRQARNGVYYGASERLRKKYQRKLTLELND